MKHLFLLFILFFPGALFAQNIDSLYAVSESSDVKKSVKAYLSLSDIYLYKNIDSSLYFLDKAIDKTSKNSEYLKLRAEVLQRKAVIINDRGDMKSALEYLKESLRIAEEINDTLLIIRTKGNIGNVYLNLYNTGEAIKYYTDVINLAEKGNYTRISAAVHGAMGNLYLTINNYEKSLEYYKKSYEYFKKLNDPNGIALSYMNMATVYSNLNRFSEALKNYKKVDKYFTEKKIMLNSAKCKSGLAKIILQNKRF